MATANGIRNALRSKDKASVSRYGGDEFIVHIEDATVSVGVIIAKRILESIHNQNIGNFYNGNDQELKQKLNNTPLKASLGVGNTESDADKALYMAKNKGRDRVEFFKEEEEQPTDKTATIKHARSHINRALRSITH